MTTITLRVSDDDLALIDAEAGDNRTQFIRNAARKTVRLRRRQRRRLDAEVSRILLEDAERDLTVMRGFALD